MLYMFKHGVLTDIYYVVEQKYVTFLKPVVNAYLVSGLFPPPPRQKKERDYHRLEILMFCFYGIKYFTKSYIIISWKREHSSHKTNTE